jgi:hypothetical protein
MEGVKSLGVQPRWTPRRKGRGAFVMVAAGTWEALPGPVVLRKITGACLSYNRRGAGKWMVAGRESEAAGVLREPTGQHNPR